ncbi:MAG: lamin tail domain-containing protein [Chloroflexi bacterium]|nr:lamin tail domain-containing protein [Chloroflexota bacterium]
MKFLKRTLPFILLNILVSAVTIYAVLMLWQRQNPAPQLATPVLPTQTSPDPKNQPTSTSNPEVIIENVFGAGDINTEYILLRNTGSTPVNLVNWRLTGLNAQQFNFPVINLNTNGAVRLYSREGSSSVIELYWGSASALWKSGDTLTLTDSEGSQQASFTIP